MLLFFAYPARSYAQTERVEELPFGDMDTWMVRKVKESAVIGGNTRYFHEITWGDTLVDAPYKNTLSPWGTSSV
ncbi:MAG: hypothetical protein LUD68_01140 [Rikenellaceae bacterium]|nr:hypothetical protein [Rikenellaceae bacterium]